MSDHDIEPEGDLTDEELVQLERRFGEPPPIACPVCRAPCTSIEAVGGGRITYACPASKTAREGRIDWDHYGASSHERVSGHPDVIRLVTEVRRRRANDPNPRADLPPGQRRSQVARRKRATRRK